MDPRVKPEDDGVWGDFWSKNSEEPGRGCDFDVGFSQLNHLPHGRPYDGIPATDPNLGSVVYPLLAISRGPCGDGLKPIAREVDAVEQISDDFRNFLCGSALGVFFLHAASHKFFQI
ncbi:hypothetical protein PYR71_02495 [Rhizobium sp. MC63]|uniref:Uncharacterized protein n=1 Tax=Rhizobium mulingense TaxID=3031128 RepID=A0ACC6MV41_9HYPH|nr:MULTISPECIES: hypothetical protein [unclassified Rhizobium]MDF0695397.1 hypothetical protein [Rhizobium sp. MC63]MEA3517239.1 hypothetical protein [Rhizobium sp. MJ31]MEB3042899.1 hypothetical protein [Rhizobium sp. MJ21]